MQPDSWVSQMRKGLVEFCLLAALRQRDDYGYAIIERLNAERALVFSESTVYPALGRLTKEGLLRSYKGPATAGPPRRYYGLSDAGHARFLAMAAYWSDLRGAVDGLIESGAENHGQTDRRG